MAIMIFFRPDQSASACLLRWLRRESFADLAPVLVLGEAHRLLLADATFLIV